MLGGCRNDNITRSICLAAGNLYIHCMLVHMACGIRVRTEVMGLDPPWSTCTCTCRHRVFTFMRCGRGRVGLKCTLYM